MRKCLSYNTAGAGNQDHSSEDGPGCPETDRGGTQLGRWRDGLRSFGWLLGINECYGDVSPITLSLDSVAGREPRGVTTLSKLLRPAIPPLLKPLLRILSCQAQIVTMRHHQGNADSERICELVGGARLFSHAIALKSTLIRQRASPLPFDLPFPPC